MTLTERIRYLTDGLDVIAPGLSLTDLEERLPDVRKSTLKRTVRVMVNKQQLVVRCDAQHVYRMFSGPKAVRIMRTKPEKDAEREAQAKYNNGNQQLVYESIQRGHALVGEIMQDTGLEEATVRNHIRRLQQQYKVERQQVDGPARYVSTRRTDCLLARVWKGQPAEGARLEA